jgi:hypothetical protein
VARAGWFRSGDFLRAVTAVSACRFGSPVGAGKERKSVRKVMVKFVKRTYHERYQSVAPLPIKMRSSLKEKQAALKKQVT